MGAPVDQGLVAVTMAKEDREAEIEIAIIYEIITGANISGNILTTAEIRTEMVMNLRTGGGRFQEPIFLDNLQVQNLEFSPFLKEQTLGRRTTVTGNTTTMKGTGHGACLVIGRGLHQLGLTG